MSVLASPTTSPAPARPPAASGRAVSVALLIPVLNEAEALPSILAQIDPAWVDEIVFVDGGSTDGSQELIRRWGHGTLYHQRIPGISNAYWEAFPHIRSPAIITFSPDGNSLPEAIPRLAQTIQEGADMVVASRYLPGAGSDDDDPVTAFGNRLFTTAINLLFGGHYTDCLVMLRVYRKSLITELGMDTRAPAFEPQLCIRCAVHRRPVSEIPMREPKRIGGVRKMRIWFNGLGVAGLIVHEWIRTIRGVQ